MGGQTVDLGPWPGGLNLVEDSRVVNDQQLVVCQNFNIGRAGELSVRTGMKNSTSMVGVSRTLGSVTLPTGYTRFFVRRTDVSPNTVYYTDDGTTYTLVGTTVANQVSAVVQHVGVINTPDMSIPYAWFVPRGSSATGYRMRLDTNALDTTNYSTPPGSGALIFKERMFIWGPTTEGGAGTYRIYYSAVGDFTNWPANNSFDVGPGDGDFVQALAVQGDSLIIFKTRSTWAMYFDLDPFNGSLRRVNSEIGATGAYSVGTYQNEIYVISRNSIYRMVNLLFEDIGKNLNLISIRGGVNFNTLSDMFSPVTGQLLFRVAIGTGYRYFVYNYDAQSWSEYTFTSGGPDRLVPFINATRSEQYLSMKEGTSTTLDYRPTDLTTANYGDNAAVGVAGTTIVQVDTKRYSWGSPTDYKRVFWWALEGYGGVGGGQISTRVATDDGAFNTAVSDTTPIGVHFVIKRSGVNRCKYVQFRITSTSTNPTFTVLGGQVNTQEKEKVRLSVNP